MVTERSVKTLLTTYLSCFFQQLKAVVYSFIFYLNNHFTQLIHLLWFCLICFLLIFFFFFFLLLCFVYSIDCFIHPSLISHNLLILTAFGITCCVLRMFSAVKSYPSAWFCVPFFLSFFFSLFFSHKIIVTFCVCMVCLKELVMHMGSAYSMTVSC